MLDCAMGDERATLGRTRWCEEEQGKQRRGRAKATTKIESPAPKYRD